MTEVPSEVLINQVSAGLYNRIATEKLNTVGSMRTIEVLSALSRRPQPEFASAKAYFSTIVDLLTTRPDGDISTLEAALTSDPETAMRLIPGLLDHPSPQWRQAAVRLLRDTGSPEALDHLVLLLKKPDDPVQTEAGRVLADLLKTRGDELIQHSLLMPERQDRQVWPLEDYFPGRLALPIIEAVANTVPTTEAVDRIITLWGSSYVIKAADRIVEVTGNQAIDAGIQALKAAQYKSKANTAFLRQWRHVPRDIKLAKYRQRCGTVFLHIGFAAALLVGLMSSGIIGWNLLTNKVMVWSSPLQIKTFDAKSLQDVQQKAETVVSLITNTYPPNASGWVRILPWNWFVEPVVPESTNAAFKHLQAIAEQGYLAERRILNAEDVKLLLGLQIPAITVKELTTAIEALPTELRSQNILPHQTNLLVKLASFVLPLSLLPYFILDKYRFLMLLMLGAKKRSLLDYEYEPYMVYMVYIMTVLPILLL